jgi:hypothetical protein
METSAETAFLLRPLFIGLYIGLFTALVVFVREKIQQRRLKKQIAELRRHMQTKLEIEAEAQERRREEIEQLKRENENLRITLQAYYEKPGRRELRQLHQMQRAVEILTDKAPGFAQSWQSALREGEEEIKHTERGILPLVRKLLPGVSPAAGRRKTEQE